MIRPSPWTHVINLLSQIMSTADRYDDGPLSITTSFRQFVKNMSVGLVLGVVESSAFMSKI